MSLLVCMKTRRQSRPPWLPGSHGEDPGCPHCSGRGLSVRRRPALKSRIPLFAGVETICPSFHFTPRYFLCLDASSPSGREAAFLQVFGRKEILLIIHTLKNSRQGSVSQCVTAHGRPVCHR